MMTIFFKNSGDWPKELQGLVDQLCAHDGDPHNLSSADMEQGANQLKDIFCDGNNLSKFSALCPIKIPSADIDGYAVSLKGLRSKLSKDNPIHEYIEVEAGFRSVSQKEREKTYALLEDILLRVKDMLAAYPDMSPQNKLKTVYVIMKEMGFSFHDQEEVLFIKNMASKSIDCDSSSLIVMAIGHEFGWPLHIVDLPDHAFVRWCDGDLIFNIDAGIITSDWEYFKDELDKFKVSKLVAHAYYLRGTAKEKSGDYKGAIEDFDKALKINPNFIIVYNNRGVAKGMSGDYKGAIEDFDEGLKFTPNEAIIYDNRGNAKEESGDYKGAVEDFEKVLSISPNYPWVSMRLHFLKFKMDCDVPTGTIFF